MVGVGGLRMKRNSPGGDFGRTMLTLHDLGRRYHHRRAPILVQRRYRLPWSPVLVEYLPSRVTVLDL